MNTPKTRLSTFVSCLAGILILCCSSFGQAQNRKSMDVEAVQGVLAVRALDGWLLAENKGNNPVAIELVKPNGKPVRQWFYFVPALGQPRMLIHRSEMSFFDAIPGKKFEYSGFRDLKSGLRSLLAGSTSIAMEWAPKSGISSLTRVDKRTVDMISNMSIDIQSSADLVQFTKSLWGPDGRLAHYLAVHHLSKLREEALQFVAERIRDNRPVSEIDVHNFLENGYRVRGLVGSISVATGDNTTKPNYRPSKRSSKAIKADDLVVLRLDGAMQDRERPIFASISWVAYVGKATPERYQRLFSLVVDARDTTVAFIREKVAKRKLVKGFEADQKAREVVGKQGMASRFVHRTGHSLDTSLLGDGANLDDFETHDSRNLVVGSGFTVGPGVYVPGDFGVQSTVNVHIVQGGIEVTTPEQKRITPILR